MKRPIRSTYRIPSYLSILSISILLILSISLMIVAGCSVTRVDTNTTAKTIDYGDIVSFSFLETNITVDGSLTVISANNTKEIFTYEYCDIPFAILMETGNHWTYVYPDTLECGTPQNRTFIPDRTVSLDDISLRGGSGLVPGRYMFKIYYSTSAPATFMREFKQIIEIR